MIIALVCEVPLCPRRVSVCFFLFRLPCPLMTLLEVLGNDTVLHGQLYEKKKNMDMEPSAGLHASASATSTGLRITAELLDPF